MPDFCGTCKAPIVWAISPAGKPSPIDADPEERGNVLLLRSSELDAVLAVVLSKDALERARERQVRLRVSHWSTCPDKAEWRERQAEKRRAKGDADG